ncbi:hypothetical protein AB0A74_09610 [Saccharothrix sp. NPDC042600]|uniref:hypothetical protein n=1 Tax=Saccharothrix TaxID=2071 RepID=UPI0033F21F9C|nr:hypothetical protein GCM10017745_35530 [Saccharothrix mutabilis subsp. capreolus]
MDKDELLFLARLASVNTALGRYIARLMDEAAGRGTTTYSVPLAEIEDELGQELMQLGRVLVAKGTGQQSGTATGTDLELPAGGTAATSQLQPWTDGVS